jgi:drug/metabolite transporter (DMT)-like permease
MTDAATPPGWGEVLSLLAAVAWAFAVILFRRSGEHVHPLGLGLFKNVLAAACFLATIPLAGETLFRSAPAGDYALLLASGALGIGLGDTLFFLALNTLGAGRVAIVDCLYSPFIIGLSMLWLGERLTLAQAAGAVMVLSAVLAITTEGWAAPAERTAVARGVLWGALALACMAVGIVGIKPLLERSPLLWVTEIRLFGGIALLAVVLALHPGRRAIIGSIRSPQRWRYTVSGSFVGTYVAMLFWLGGMKLAKASIAAALNQTSNVFIFAFAALFLRERITRVRAAGLVLGVSGVLVILYA